MPKYKVGDVAALFSKPKNPTTAGGKKLQSLFEDFYNKKSKPVFYSQKKENFEINRNTEDVEGSNPSASKKSRKRKLSSNDSELNENVFSKKFKESSEQGEGSKNSEITKFKKCEKQEDFPRKNNNDSDLNENAFSKKMKKSFEQEGFKSNVSKKMKKQQDFQRKKKKSKFNSLNTNSVFPKFETGNVSGNDTESSFAFKLQNVPIVSIQNKNFIKKSKKKNIDYDCSKLSDDVLGKDFDDSDTSLKNELKKFMLDYSRKSKIEGSDNNVMEGKAFNCKEPDAMKKSKKKHLINEVSSPQKCEGSFKQDKKNINNQQDFTKIKKKLKVKLFNCGNTESEIKLKNVEQDSLLKKPNSIEKKDKKQSKKLKHELNDAYANSFSTSENNSETYAPKTNKMADFIRRPKNKKSIDNTLGKDDLKKPRNKAFDSGKVDKHFKHKEFSVDNTMQIKKSGTETLDFIKLPDSDAENDERDSEETLSRTLFVANLSKNTSKQELKNLFAAFGIIKAIRLTGIENDKAKIYGKNPPKLLHSNYASDTVPGFVVFQDRQSAVQALQLSGSVFKGHHITVDFALPAGTQKIYDDKRSIFIGNLPFDVKDESIWNAFNDCGRIEGVRVVRDRNTGLGKGFGYVLFSTVKAKENALSLESLKIDGRDIRIKPANSNKKAQKSYSSSVKRDTFKSRAIRLKKNKVTSGRKSIKKLTNKQKNIHEKKKIASFLQKAMK